MHWLTIEADNKNIEEMQKEILDCVDKYSKHLEANPIDFDADLSRNLFIN